MREFLSDNIKGIRFRLMCIILVILETILVSVSIICAAETAKRYNRIDAITNDYIRMQEDIYNIREASDFLTTRARQYVITAEEEYAAEYFKEINVDKKRDVADENVNSAIKAVNMSEISHLDEALEQSKALEEVELHAMALIYSISGHSDTIPIEIAKYKIPEEELALKDSARREIAHTLVFDKEYISLKTAIADDIEEASNYLLDIITVYKRNCTAEYHQASITLKTLLGVCAILFIVIVVALFSLILTPLTGIIQAIDGDKKIEYGSCYELNYLAHSYNSLLERNALSKQRLKDTAERDELTGLLNRNGYEGVKKYFTDSEENLAFLIMDVDNFKKVNDTYGHDGGDKALQRVAGLLKDSFRENDFLIRYGGDEFIVIMTGLESANKAVVQRKLDRINEALSKDDGLCPLSVSIGIAFSNKGYTDRLFEMADEALYKTKARGRCGYTFI